MPVRPFSREQAWLLPPRLDDLLPDDHAARYVAEFVDSLDSREWQKLGIGINGEPLGAPEYHPRVLLSVWLYGFMTRTRSSRKLEAACRDQISYLWLTGWQHPDHNTLWRFYKEHRDQMRHLFKYSIQVAVKLNLIDLALQAVDGTKVAANASKSRTYDAKGLKRLMERTEDVIQDLEKQNEAGNDLPTPRLPEKLRQAKQLRTEVKAAMERLTTENLKRINLTDGDVNLMKARQGIIPGYNVQGMVSPLKTTETQKITGMIITAADVVLDTVDTNQLTPMMEQAEENTDKKVDMTLADAGYHSGANLANCEQRKQKVAMPESQDRELQKPYHKDKFTYNPDTDSYTCPHGQTLRFVRIKLVRNTKMRIYHVSGAICRQCKAFGQCTTCNHHGRELQIGPNEAVLKRHRAWMATEEAKAIYSRRKELVEPTFGIIKEQMGFKSFLLRGLSNARAEGTLMVTAFNVRTLYHVWRAQLREKRELLDTALQNVLGNVAFLGLKGAQIV
jgi:transposase